MIYEKCSGRLNDRRRYRCPDKDKAHWNHLILWLMFTTTISIKLKHSKTKVHNSSTSIQPIWPNLTLRSIQYNLTRPPHYIGILNIYPTWPWGQSQHSCYAESTVSIWWVPRELTKWRNMWYFITSNGKHENNSKMWAKTQCMHP